MVRTITVTQSMFGFELNSEVIVMHFKKRSALSAYNPFCRLNR